MRAFLAIQFSETIRRAYAAAFERLESRFPGLRWVRPERLHLTLRFLGELSEDEGGRLYEAVGRHVSEPAFRLSFGAAGAFGPRRAPRTLWIEVEEGREALERLQPQIEAAVREAGYPPEAKPWRPHITIARSRPGRKGVLSAAEWQGSAEAAGLRAASCEASEVVLVSSLLGPGGPSYTPVWSVRLGRNAKLEVASGR
jgi:2'-5' RNA ligase